MADNYISQMICFFEIGQEINDLALDRNIQGRQGFVGNDEVRAQDERPREGNPLTLTAAELMGVFVEIMRLQADLSQGFFDLFDPGQCVADLVNDQRFTNNLSDTEPWIERSIGVLEEQMHLPAERQFLPGSYPMYILTIKFDRAAVWCEQHGSRACQG